MTLPSGLTLRSMDARRGRRLCPALRCVHGMFGGAWRFDAWLALLADRGYEVHAFNPRARHGSRPVADFVKVSFRDVVDDALEAARVLGEPIVVGHSMGGLIAQKMAEAGAVRAANLPCAAPPRGILARPTASASPVRTGANDACPNNPAAPRCARNVSPSAALRDPCASGPRRR